MKDAKSTLDAVNTEGVNEKGMELLQKLNINVLPGKQPGGSIMSYGDICNCDDDFLCEHRLQVIADWIKENQKPAK
jgi:hypothetical protein